MNFFARTIDIPINKIDDVLFLIKEINCAPELFKESKPCSPLLSFNSFYKYSFYNKHYDLLILSISIIAEKSIRITFHTNVPPKYYLLDEIFDSLSCEHQIFFIYHADLLK